MNRVRSVLFAAVGLALGGCWVAHTAHDRPQLRQEIGRVVHLTNPAIVFRGSGGQLHLTDDLPRYYAPVVRIEERLPAGTQIRIKDVIYRITEAGRYDYYVLEVSGQTNKWEVEVNLTHLPAWE